MKRFSVNTYLILSLVAAAFLGAVFYAGTDNLETALVAAGITFIVTLVTIATLALSVRDDDQEADKPRLK